MKLLQFLKTTLLIFIGKKALPASSQKATIKFSALLTGIKGLVGGTVFTAVKSGAVMQNNTSMSSARNKFEGPSAGHHASTHTLQWPRSPVISRTGFLNPDGAQLPNPKYLASKQNVRTVSKAWSQLLDSDRAEWYWVAINGPSKNRFGDSYTPSAYQTYMRYNLNLMAVGLGPLARPVCTVVKFIDDEAQEEMACLVCDNEVVCCVYTNDLSDSSDRLVQPRMQTKCTGNPAGTMLIYSSLPMRKGRSRANTMQLIACIKPCEGYNNFLLRPTFNLVFGTNIGGLNFQYKTVYMSPGGNQTVVASGVYSPNKTTDAEKLAYTLFTQDFVWQGDGSTINFGSVGASDTPIIKTIIIYGIELPASTNYQIALVGGSDPLFSFYYGSQSDPLNPLTQVTDIYGSIPPIPLLIYFTPSTSGVKNAVISVTCNGITMLINLTGTVT